MCVCVCVCVRERERERPGGGEVVMYHLDRLSEGPEISVLCIVTLYTHNAYGKSVIPVMIVLLSLAHRTVPFPDD